MELLIHSILWVLLRNLSLRFSTVFVGDAKRICVSRGRHLGPGAVLVGKGPLGASCAADLRDLSSQRSGRPSAASFIGGTINTMQIEFDSMKRDKTLLERGLDFAHADLIFAGLHFTSQGLRVNYAEDRFIAVGFLQADLVVMVWTPRGAARRTISMRKANEREKAFYTQYLD